MNDRENAEIVMEMILPHLFKLAAAIDLPEVFNLDSFQENLERIKIKVPEDDKT